MKQQNEIYSNGQKVTEQKGDVQTYYFENGEIKAKGRYIDGVMDGEWIFNKKEGYLWQVGHFDMGKRQGSWIRYNADGSVADEKHFENDKQVKG